MTRDDCIKQLDEKYFGGKYRFFPDNWSPDILAVPVYSNSRRMQTEKGWLIEIIPINYCFIEDNQWREIKERLGPTPQEELEATVREEGQTING